MSTFIWAVVGTVAVIGYLALGCWMIVMLLCAVDREETWAKFFAALAAFVVATALGFTVIAKSIDERCPPGTTHQYHATGPKDGYYYCEREPR